MDNNNSDLVKSPQEEKILQLEKQILELEGQNQALSILPELIKTVLSSLEYTNVVQKIANLIPQHLGYQTGVLALIDKDQRILKRVAISQTSGGVAALKSLEVPFHEINIPLDAKENITIQVIDKKERMITTSLYEVLRPAISKENADEVQKIMGTSYSIISPLLSGSEVIGIFIISTSRDVNQFSPYEWTIIDSFVDVVGLVVMDAMLYKQIKETGAKLESANQQLKELDRLKSEFVSVASHELRTPMTSIKSYLWMALDGRGGVLSEKQKYYLDRAYSSTDRLIKLVNDLLNVSRIESGRLLVTFEKVSLEALVKDVITEIKPRIDELKINVTVDHNDKNPIPEVLADPDKIKEVVVNLIGNSLKFTQPGGQIRIWFEINNGLVVTHVIDNGVGIEQSELPKLFQKFGLVAGSYTTNQQVSQGTGLGLYISKSIVEMHGGKMWAGSEGKGKGATFSFSLKVFNQEEFNKCQKENQGKEGLGIIHSGI